MTISCRQELGKTITECCETIRLICRLPLAASANSFDVNVINHISCFVSHGGLDHLLLISICKPGQRSLAPDELKMTKRYGLVLILFTLVWLFVCWPWLSGALTIPYDAKAHFQAQIQFLARAIHDGQSPFWTPNVFAGSPQIADPQSLIFSPAILLALISRDPTFWMVDVFTFSLLLLAGYAIIAFFKDREWHPAGALLAACITAFGASAAWRIQHIGQIQSHAFLAISLWLLARALQRGTVIWGFCAGLAAGVMIVEPDQVAYLGCIVLAAMIADYVLVGGEIAARVKSRLPMLIAAAIGGAIIVAGPLLMTVLFAEASNRPDISFAEATRGSLSPAAFLTFLFGDLFAAAERTRPYWGPSSEIWSPQNYFLSPNMTQTYCGALAALLLGISFATRLLWVREMRVYACLLVFNVIYALGNFTPLFQWLFDVLPGIDAFRRPADATFTFGFIIAIVSGYVLHALIAGKVKFTVWRWRLLAIAMISASASALAAGYSVGHFSDATRHLGRGLLWLAAGGALLTVLMHRSVLRPNRYYAPVMLMLLAVFLAADFSANNGPSESTGLPPKTYEALKPDTDNATIKFLRSHTQVAAKDARRDRVELLGVGFIWPNLGMVHGFDHTLGYNPLRLADFTAATGAGDTIAGPDQRHFTKLFPSYRCVLADLLGLRFIASSVPIEQIDKRIMPGDLTIVERTKDAIIYENKRALPRALFVRDFQVADFDQLISSGQWPDFDPRRTVLLEKAPDPVNVPAVRENIRLTAAETALRESGPHVSTLQLNEYHNTIIRLTVDSSTAGFVVLNDVWHPWWRATIDGEAADILKANVLFRAVAVPPGRHEIVFEFKPFAGAIAELGERLFDQQ